MEFAHDGGGLAKGCNVSLFVDGSKVGGCRVAATQPMTFSSDETAVAEDYTMHTSAFNGKINWVQLDAGVDDNDHFISPEERLRVAMARQYGTALSC
jgi:hypothetical protein